MPDLDAAWFRSLALDNILPHWLEHAVTGEGLFLPKFDRQWRPVGEPAGTCVSQTRLLHNFAVGYDLTNDERYLRAVECGARFLIDHFRDPDHGGWFHAVGPGGAVVDPHKNAYDHAFAIFGLAHAARVTGDKAFAAAMRETWDLLDTRFRDEHGGFIRVMTRDLQPNEERRTQNPTMHLFEALLAASDVDPDMLEHAEQVGRWVVGRLMRWDGQPCQPELFDLDWSPLAPDRGGYVCVGHQFEWAFLLSWAVDRGLPSWWLSPATDLLQFGLRWAYDAGAIIEATDYVGGVTRARKGWWEQCELIRTLIHFAVQRGRADLWAPVREAVAFAEADLVDHEYGGWFTSPEPPTDDAPPKGGGFKVDYHVVGMCAEAIRLLAAD